MSTAIIYRRAFQPAFGGAWAFFQPFYATTRLSVSIWGVLHNYRRIWRRALAGVGSLKQRKRPKMRGRPIGLSAARRHRALSTVAVVVCVLTLPSIAFGETLREALTAAYLFNPTLKAARAQLRATDNQVSIAKSGYRPTVSASLQYGFEDTRTRFAPPPPGFIAVCAVPTAFDGTCPGGQSRPAPLSSLGRDILPNGTSNPRIAQLNLQQNVFDGFQTYNNIT